MTVPFVKVYTSILDSSVWGEPPATRCVWIAMQLVASESGWVGMGKAALIRRANVSPTEFDAAIAFLAAPDAANEWLGSDGRRIVTAEPIGWMILPGRPSEVIREHIPLKVRQVVWIRDAGRCVQCDTIESIEYDHIVPVVHGGTNDAGNLQLLCRSCNMAKGPRPYERRRMAIG